MKQKNVIIGIIMVIAILAAVFYFTTTDTESESATIPPEDTRPTPTSSATDVVTVSLPESPISPISPNPLPTETVMPLDSEMLQSKIDQGIQSYESGDYNGAIEIFTSILEQVPNSFIAYNARGSAYEAIGEYDKAMDDFTKSIEFGNTFPYPYYNRGRLYATFGQYDEALVDMQKSIENSIEGFGYRANGNIGLIYHKMAEYDQALAAFAESISFNTDERADVYYLRGETYTALEDYEAAIADYLAAIERYSSYNKAYQSLGYAYYKTDRLDQATQNLNQALEISPDSPIAHFYLALVHVATDQFGNAEQEISLAVNSIDTLSEEEQEFILTRVSSDLELFAQQNPERAKEIEALIDSLPKP